jgi:hypothetical protein
MSGQGMIVNRGHLLREAPHAPTWRERLLSEITFERKRGDWKRANDLKKHYDKLIERERREGHGKR